MSSWGKDLWKSLIHKMRSGRRVPPPCLRTKQLCHFVEQANVSSQGTELTAWVLRKINGLDFQFKGNRCF